MTTLATRRVNSVWCIAVGKTGGCIDIYIENVQTGDIKKVHTTPMKWESKLGEIVKEYINK